MMIWVKLFAAAKQRAGAQVTNFAFAEGATVADLRKALAAEYPTLADFLPHCRIAVNCDFAGDEVVLSESQEIGVIPPVSGG
ncbi:MoaD/ThiS family protein [Anatilimnocola floriformis]|uniref:MoaD/ThiS family protein n=1 Tax=Anatilimnocola floriformis TaxID=2948575 RepID=UPI0020C33D42|nr:MoaD/ThiS family protein [Anatilimnocola floriformis]